MANVESKTKRILIGIFVPITALLLSFSILCIVTMTIYSPVFLGRVLTHFDSSVTDYNVFAERIIEKSDTPYKYSKHIDYSLDDALIEYSSNSHTLSEFINKTDTTSFLVVKNDVIIYEKYANGYNENSINTSFSMAKSVVSLLIGKLIEDGYIKSAQQPISDFINEFNGLDIGKTTIEELLLMRSKIQYEENKFLWFGDDSLTYWYDNLRKLALSHTILTEKYNGRFHYNNYHPLLLGIIIERTTGESVSKYFERAIWKKIGAENSASWSLDSKNNAFEKMESGINFTSVDFIKIGSMVLHNGYWNDNQIIESEWLKTSALCEFPIDEEEYKSTFLQDKNIGYKYMWYSTPSEKSGYDVIAWGKSDQIMYISPSNETVILRTGKSDGGISNWVELLKKFISQNLQG